MIDRDHGLSVSRQCAALGISRGSVYYEPAAVSQSDLALMRRLDELHLGHPHAGSRMLRDLLAVLVLGIYELAAEALAKLLSVLALGKAEDVDVVPSR
jgi:putative transposase